MIFDFENFGKKNLVIDRINCIFEMADVSIYYVIIFVQLVLTGMIYEFYLINLGWGTKLLFNLIYPFIPESGQKRLNYFSASETPKELAKRIDEKWIPSNLGGQGRDLKELLSEYDYDPL